MTDPERSLDRARETWQKHGRSEKWIQQRMMGQETRNKLTDYWKDHDIKENKEWFIRRIGGEEIGGGFKKKERGHIEKPM